MISGGCLEAEVSRKAWWLTESGPSVQSYGTFFDEDNPSPQELGCGGTVHLLLERSHSATAALEVINESAENRVPFAMLTVIKSGHPQIGLASRFIQRGRSEICRSTIPLDPGSTVWSQFMGIAAQTLTRRYSECVTVRVEEFSVELFAEYVEPPPSLFIFGAGDDAIPLVDFAQSMGWHITVADLRSNLATAARFPHADQVVLLKRKALAGNGAIGMLDLAELRMGQDDAAVIMTHSYVQDRALLPELLPLDLTYLGLLGPRLRTSKLLCEIAPETDFTIDECASKLHSPVGLDLGADNPAGIALSIVAEVQAAIHDRASHRFPAGNGRPDNLPRVASRVAAKIHA